MSKKAEQWIYEVIAFGACKEGVMVEAPSMIEAVRKVAKTRNVRKGILSGHKIPWHYLCYKYKLGEGDIPYTEGYYHLYE